MIDGSCLCGTVCWRCEAGIEELGHCHCSMCRKAHGAPFATYGNASAADFDWLAGEESVAHHASSPQLSRSFCKQCGSVVPFADRRGVVNVPAGCLDTDPGIRPSAHIFVASKAPWHEISDDLPRFDAYPPGTDLPAVDRPTLDPPAPGTLRGSCLCGAVGYEVIGAIKAVHNCHCSRCRKARASAHTTNGFTSIDGVRFVRGEADLSSYKLPSARFFTQAFCRHCGSGMPRLDAARGIAVIPFGSLDDDPGRGADDHIFYASKAPWYEVHDALPRFDEMPG